jgi:hypothetical protein
MSDGMYTPWGMAQVKQQLAQDVFLVQTFDEKCGGILIAAARAEALLSDRARIIGQHWEEFLAFEQEAMMVVLYEHPELYPWVEEELTERFAEESVRQVYPGYFVQEVQEVIQ